jgi:type I restriction enzyme M protein
MTHRELVPKKVTRDELNSLVDKAADLIRTAVDYKFILVLLFLKRVNDLSKTERDRYKQRLKKIEGMSEKEIEKEMEKADYYTFNIPRQFHWDEITKDVKTLPEKLATAISETAKLNTELQGVINRVDFLEFARNQENRDLLHQLVELFNKYDLAGEEVSPDVLGDAYEHILMKFAPERAKEGEIYTPREVIKLMVEILDPKPKDSVYDPCCGSGGMLIISYLHLAQNPKYGEKEARKLFLYGQERNPEIYAVGQMNLLLHDIKNAHLENGDTLENPRFRDNGRLKQFDVVIANIPWNQDGYNEGRLKAVNFKDRFSFGHPPQSSADWAWIQHMLASAKEDGRIAVVVDNGCLFRGGQEKVVRSKLAGKEKDWIECIILLPEKIFYNTGAPGTIIVFNRKKAEKRKNKILFINASNDFIRHPSIRRLNTLSSDNIGRIVEAYSNFSEFSGFSRAVDAKEIAKNDYNLNVSLYVMPIEEAGKISISQVYSDLKKLEEERNSIDKELEEVLTKVAELEQHGPNSLSRY